MPTLDLLVKADKPRPTLPYAQRRLRYAGGEVVDFVLAGAHPGTVPLQSERWRIIRVDLPESEARMLCSRGEPLAEDIAAGIPPRRRLYALALRALVPGARLTIQAYDLRLTREALMAAVIRKPDERRDLGGQPLEPLGPVDESLLVDER